MSGSPRTASFSASLTLITLAHLAAPAIASLPNQHIAAESGYPRRWHAGRPVNAFSTVNMRYGNLHTTIPIVSWSGRGPAIQLALHHDSASAQSVTTVPATSGADLGKGWVHSYGATLKVVGTDATLVESDGSVRTFTKPSSTWVTTTGFYDTLTDVGTDGWKLTEKDQSYRRFGPSGTLTKLVDSAGNEIVLTYATVFGETRLTTVTDASTNRALTLDYNSNGRLTTITAPLDASSNRVWTLDYNSNGNLAHVYAPITDATTSTIALTYDAGTDGLIATFSDANTHVTTFTYAAAKIATVTDPMTYTQSFTWNTPTASNYNNVYTDRNGHTWTYNFSYAATNDETVAGDLLRVTDPLTHFNAWFYVGHERITHRDANSNTWLYDYTTDGRGNLAKQTDPYGDETLYDYNTNFSKASKRTDPDEVTPSRRITLYDYNSNGLMVSTTDANTHVSYVSYYDLAGAHPEWNGLPASRTDRNGVITTYEYDTHGQLTDQVVDAATSGLHLHSEYEYSKAGWLVSSSDANTHVTAYTYDRQGRNLTAIVDPGSSPHLHLQTINEYDPAGRRINSTNPRGTVTHYDYDANDRLETTTADVGGYEFETIYDYDSNGNRLAQTDAEANVTQWGYDNANRVISMTDAESNVTTYDLDTNGNRVLITDANTHITLNTYDKLNRVTQVQVDTDNLNLTTQYEYAETGGGGGCGCGGGVGKSHVRHMIDADGKHTFYKYDLLDRKIAVVRKVDDTDADADTNDAVTEYDYDFEGRLTQTIVQNEPANLVTNQTYDNAGRLLTTVVDPGGLALTTTYDYNSNGTVYHMKTPSGDATTNYYDAAGRRTGATDPIGLVESLTLDENGNVTERIVPGASTNVAADYVFDALDRMETMTDPLSHTTTYTYNDVGRVETITDANSHITSYEYDGNYRKHIVTDANTSTVTYEYDGVGNLLSQTAANSGDHSDQTTTYEYDGANRRITETYPDSDSGNFVRTFEYNGAGQVHIRTDQNTDVTTYTYDDLHRLSLREYTVNSANTYPGSQPPDSFLYDRAGRMLSATHDSGGGDEHIDTFTYDNAGAITEFTQGNYTIDMSYDIDANTNHRTITYPGGLVVRETGDKRGRITEIKDITTNGRPIFATNIYDNGDRLSQRQFGWTINVLSVHSGGYADYTYDNAGRVMRITHYDFNTSGPTVDLGYERDNVGNPICREDMLTPNMSEHYTYDNADRLIHFQRGTLNTISGCTLDEPNTTTTSVILDQTWTLDRLGNWNTNGVTTSTGTVTQTRTHNKANEITDISTGGDPIEPTYDDNGNLTFDGTYHYYYDIENRLTQVTDAEDGFIAEYKYDALGRRTYKAVHNTGDYDGEFTYVWNPDWQLMEIYKEDDGWQLSQTFVHAGSSSPWNSSLASSPSSLPYVDDHIAMIKSNGDLFYYRTDAQYTTQIIGDHKGERAGSHVISAYGQIETTQTVGGKGLGTAATINPLAHQGLLFDAEIAKYYNRWRIADLDHGRFLQRDPLQDVSGPTSYAYERSAPTFLTDASGLCSSSRCAAGGPPGNSTLGGGLPALPSPGPGCLSNCYIWVAAACNGTPSCVAAGRAFCEQVVCQPVIQDHRTPHSCRPPYRVPPCGTHWDQDQCRYVENDRCGAGSPCECNPINVPYPPECLAYPIDAFYCNVSATEMCACMNTMLPNDPWSKSVTNCLSCKFQGGCDVDASHHDCYAAADAVAQRPTAALLACAIRSAHGNPIDERCLRN